MTLAELAHYALFLAHHKSEPASNTIADKLPRRAGVGGRARWTCARCRAEVEFVVNQPCPRCGSWWLTPSGPVDEILEVDRFKAQEVGQPTCRIDRA